MAYMVRVGREDDEAPRLSWRTLGTFETITEAKARANKHQRLAYDRCASTTDHPLTDLSWHERPNNQFGATMGDWAGFDQDEYIIKDLDS
jgi:hypothetical protein